MKTIKYLTCILLLLTNYSLFAQDQSILIFDPNGVSSSFQYTLSQLTDDSVFVVDTIDNSIFNYDGLFLFIRSPYILSQAEGNLLIEYTSDRKPVYIYSDLAQELDSVAFWNHIGVNEFYGLLISVPIDTVFGVSEQFTSGIIIDTSFMSGLIPVIVGNVDSILIGDAEFWEVNTTYISGYDSLNVIIDLYNLIDDYDFLERVLEQFELIPPNSVKYEFNLLTGFELFQNYPNPFNPVTSIKYVVSSRQFVTLKVYDVLGNEIATLVNEEKQPGTYEVEFDGMGLPTGIYFYQLNAGSFVETKKLVLLK